MLSGIGVKSSNSGRICSVCFHINTLGYVMNSSLHFTIIGEIERQSGFSRLGWEPG